MQTHLTAAGSITSLLRCLLGLVLGMALCQPGTAQPPPGQSGLDAYSRSWLGADENNSERIDHQPWQALLERYLRTGQVDGIYRFDYAAVSSADYAALQSYLQRLQSLDPLGYSRDEQMAFWINLYNALTVEIILREKPRRSIRSTGRGWLPNGPWDEHLATINGRPLSLDDIEHRILRPLWQDPRIHFAVNCASIGCPNLQPQPFTAAQLEQQLQKAQAEFLAHPRAISFSGERLLLSKIFKWYREDFGDSEQAMLQWLAARAPADIAARLANWQGPVRYRYDWGLNRPAR